MAEPLCRLCAEKGKTTAAQEVDHILPLHKGGTNDRDNLQPICVPCHLDKTDRDMGRNKQEIGLDGWPIG